MNKKYEAIPLPKTAEEAARLAAEREEWAAHAFDNDMPGTWQQFSFAAVLLRDLEKRLKGETN